MNKTAKEIIVMLSTTIVMVFAQILFSRIFATLDIKIEIVTAIFACYCFRYRDGQGAIVGTLFSLMRLMFINFDTSLEIYRNLILYLLYFNSFAVILSLVGKKVRHKKSYIKLGLLTAISCVMICLFTLMDDLIVSVLYVLMQDEIYTYFLKSLPVMLTNVLNCLITVPLLYYPITKIYKLLK